MPRSPLEPEGADIQKEREEREKEERRWDSELAKQIADRKKSTNERGIKLTVVLMASRKMLDEPSLDGRLTYIRRSSGLDSRAALFVLSPVSPAELSDFVKRYVSIFVQVHDSSGLIAIVYSKLFMIQR